MKKIISLIMVLGLLFCVSGCSETPEPPLQNAEVLTDGNFYYQYSNGKLYAFKYYGKSKNAVVPAEFEGEKIYGINPACFGSNEMIREIHISNGIKDVSAAAFKGCKSLIRVILPEGLEEIKSETFADCPKLFEVYIPNSVSAISYGAFMNCIKLSNIRFGDNLKIIDTMAFYNSGPEWIKIPNGVQVIGNKAFAECAALRRIEIPDSMSIISDDAFENTQILIYATENSYAHEYATQKGIPFEGK